MHSQAKTLREQKAQGLIYSRGMDNLTIGIVYGMPAAIAGGYAAVSFYTASLGGGLTGVFARSGLDATYQFGGGLLHHEGNVKDAFGEINWTAAAGAAIP